METATDQSRVQVETLTDQSKVQVIKEKPVDAADFSFILLTMI